MKRALPILLAEVGAVVVAWMVAPWLAVPLAAIGLFAGGWASALETDDRALRRRIAWRVALVNGLAVAGTWWVAGSTDPEIARTALPARVFLSAALGTGAGLAALGLSLIGLDARFMRAGMPRA